MEAGRKTRILGELAVNPVILYLTNSKISLQTLRRFLVGATHCVALVQQRSPAGRGRGSASPLVRPSVSLVSTVRVRTMCSHRICSRKQLRRSRRCGTMRALTPAAPRQRDRPLRSISLAFWTCNPQPRCAARTSRALSPPCVRSARCRARLRPNP